MSVHSDLHFVPNTENCGKFSPVLGGAALVNIMYQFKRLGDWTHDGGNYRFSIIN